MNAYAPQVGLDEEERRFWEVLEEVIRGVPGSEKIFIGGDFNGHIGSVSLGYEEVHGGFGFGVRNDEGTALLDFARAFGLVVVNSSFPKKKDHLVTFCSTLAKTQIDFLLLRKEDRVLCKDCKIFPNENLVTQHRLLVMDLVIKWGKKRRGGEGRHRVRWGGLTPASALEIGAKLEGMGCWSVGGTWIVCGIGLRVASRILLERFWVFRRDGLVDIGGTGGGVKKLRKRWRRRRRLR
ncbi:uncharacterized protein LOC107844480 [Capsicum annuum]|uniref:uncharacterized protein LOC107844480 n=1 Tax=Capsicum annuum TaxID=4072 RepID=UPI001FB0FB2E|nr:uncharacterized protein LOC107844480 [Capsicum annuum]